jgi:hypothetical protein
MGCVHRNRGVVADLSLEDYAQRILALVDEQTDRTLGEFVAAMHERRSTERTWRERGAVGFGSGAFLIRRDWCLSMRLRPASIWSVSGHVARVASE